MKAQAQVPTTTSSFLNYDKCGIMHEPRECTIDDRLQPWMRSTLLVEETMFIISTPIISIKDKASDRIREAI